VEFCDIVVVADLFGVVCDVRCDIVRAPFNYASRKNRYIAGIVTCSTRR
jgi:hypothetical protein